MSDCPKCPDGKPIDRIEPAINLGKVATEPPFVKCPLCKFYSNNPAKMSIHIKFGHNPDEINQAVDDGRLIEKPIWFFTPRAQTASDVQETGNEQLARELAERLQLLYGYQVGLNDLIPALLSVLKDWNVRSPAAPQAATVEEEKEKD